MQLKTVLNNFLLIISFSIIFSYQLDGTGYSNIYAINKLSDGYLPNNNEQGDGGSHKRSLT